MTRYALYVLIAAAMALAAFIARRLLRRHASAPPAPSPGRGGKPPA